LKTNIRKIESPLDTILKMRGVSFLWKNLSGEPQKNEQKKDIGFIAQELLYSAPYLVFKEDMGNDDELYKVKYHDVIALCLEAVKEQSKSLDEKENRLQILEEKIKGV